MHIGVIGSGKQAKRYLDPRNGLGVCYGGELDCELPSHVADGAVMASHPHDHHFMTAALLIGGMPVLVEKPLATTAADCFDLIMKSRVHATYLMVAHTLLFSRRFAEIQELAKSAKHVAVDIGGPRPAGHDYSALLDWGPHAYSVGVALNAQRINFGDYPERRAVVILDGVEHSLDTRGEENPTPMATQMRVFLDLIGGKPDWRAEPEFTLRVYESLFGSGAESMRAAIS